MTIRPRTESGGIPLAATAMALSALISGGLAWAEAEAETPGESPPSPALLRVSSDPPGAEVTVDGVGCGRTPALVEVAPGPHEVLVGAGRARLGVVIEAVEGETVEVRLEGTSGPGEPPRAAPAAAPAPQRADQEPAAPATPPEADREPWHRRVPARPWLELSLRPGAFLRRFEMPINSALDTRGRELAGLTTGAAGYLGGGIAILPFAGARRELLRGLGVEATVGIGVGIVVLGDEGGRVETSHYDAEVGAFYRVAFGTADRGAEVFARLGWSRTAFSAGDRHNDVVPPFVYDSVRVGAGLSVPLLTRHLVAELQGAYLAVAGLGEQAVLAYDGPGIEPDASGGEVSGGVAARFGGFVLGFGWTGRWLVSQHRGIGRGYGFEPTTVIGMGGNGIQSTGDGVDSYHLFLFTIGYRYAGGVLAGAPSSGGASHRRDRL